MHQLRTYVRLNTKSPFRIMAKWEKSVLCPRVMIGVTRGYGATLRIP